MDRVQDFKRGEPALCTSTSKPAPSNAASAAAAAAARSSKSAARSKGSTRCFGPPGCRHASATACKATRLADVSATRVWCGQEWKNSRGVSDRPSTTACPNWFESDATFGCGPPNNLRNLNQIRMACQTAARGCPCRLAAGSLPRTQEGKLWTVPLIQNLNR